MACKLRGFLIMISFVCLLIQLSTFAAGAQVGSSNPHGDSTTHSPYEGSRNSSEEHHEEEEEHHEEEEEHHEEEHHPGHYVIWPSAIGMMLFVTLTGYAFYQCYSRQQMIKYAKKNHHATFFEKAVVSSTVAGVAAPGLLAFDKKKSKKRTIRFPKFKSTRKSKRSPDDSGEKPI